MTEVIDHAADAGIATLSAVLDAGELATCLRPVLPRHWGALWEARVHVLKHYPGKRCTVGIGLSTTSGRHDLIGKVYARDRPEVYQAMDALSKAGFGPDAAFSIPQPLVYVPALRLLLLETVQGATAREVVLAGDERERALAAQQCAYWLARFQAVAPRSGPIVDLRTHLRATDVRLRGPLAGLRPRHDGFAVACPAGTERAEAFGLGAGAGLDGLLAEKAHRLLEQLDVAATARRGVLHTPIGVCASHGSYSPSHVILGPHRTVAIDWDGYSVADPARDVARFIVALKRLALGCLGSIRALDAVADVFAQAYVAVGRPDVAARLPYYEAAICLQIASNMVRSGRPHWQMKVETMLDEGLRLLQEQD